LAAVGNEMQADLGEWIKHRLRRGVQGQGKVAEDQLEDCGADIKELEKQWVLQKDMQLSFQARTF
jgi:hypothetical protein